MFRLFKPIKPKTDQELQAELKALCQKIILQQHPFLDDMYRYERLLAEIYKRGLEPDTWLRVTSPEERKEKK